MRFEQLDLVEEFVNSLHMHEGRDDEEALGSPQALRAWLVERELLAADAQVSRDELARALDVREGLRALALANNGETLDAAAVERLDRAAGHAGLRVRAARGEPRLEAGPDGVDGALATVLSAVATAVADGSWARFKACPRDCCQWAFYDRSRNRSARWCEMETCGNVEKARAYRERKRDLGGP